MFKAVHHTRHCRAAVITCGTPCGCHIDRVRTKINTCIHSLHKKKSKKFKDHAKNEKRGVPKLTEQSSIDHRKHVKRYKEVKRDEITS